MRSDLFGLGVVLYEMVAGVNPFATEHPATTLEAISGHHPAPLGAILLDVPTSLSDLASSLLAKRPEERPQSAADALRDLETLVRTHGADGRNTLRGLIGNTESALRQQDTERAATLVERARRAAASQAQHAAVLLLDEALKCDPGHAEARSTIQRLAAERPKPWDSGAGSRAGA